MANEIALGVLFTIISMAPMWAEFKPPEGAHHAVDIGVGMAYTDPKTGKPDLDDAMGFGGDIPGIALFNSLGGRIGMHKGGGKQGAGGTAHVNVDSVNKNNNQGAEYITVSQARDNIDAICITHVATTATSGDNDHYALAVGEIAAQCNGVGRDWPWYPSARGVQIKKADGTAFTARPKCLMLDTPDDHNIRNSPYAGFAAHLIDFNLDNSHWKGWENDLHQMCDSNSRFWLYPTLNEMQCPQVFDGVPEAGAKLPMKEITACHPDVWTPDPHKDKALTFTDAHKLYVDLGVKDPNYNYCPVGSRTCRRAAEYQAQAEEAAASSSSSSSTKNVTQTVRPRKTPFHKRLVKSNFPEHSAVEVCADKATVGPDFFSEIEQKLCHMPTHELYDVCSAVVTTKCFDLATHNIRFEGQLHTRDNADYVSHDHWGYQEEDI